MKKLIFFCLFMSPLFIGCAMTNARSIRGSQVDTQAQMRAFDEAKSISVSEIPQLYDASRLKVASKVKTKHTSDTASKPYFTSRVLRDIQASAGQKLYISDLTVENNTYTFKEDTSSLSKLISPEEDAKPMVDYKGPNRDSLLAVIIRDTLGAGIVGGLVSVFDYQRMKEMNREIAEHIKGLRIETKVIDFKFISNETLKVAGKDIVCKVYQAHSMTRQTLPAQKKISSPTFITDKIEQIWISDDVPFGIVKSRSTMEMHICPDPNDRFQSKMANPGPQHADSEVVEFSY